MKTERDTVLCGMKIGEHEFDPENAINSIKKRCVDRDFSTAYVRPAGLKATYKQEEYIKWAEYMAKNKIYLRREP